MDLIKKNKVRNIPGKQIVKKDVLPVEKLSKENIICGLVIFGFVVSVIYHSIAAFYMGHNFYPYNTFLSSHKGLFPDFYSAYNASKALNPYADPSSILLPFPFVLMYILTFFSPIISYILITALFIVCFIIYLYKNIQHTNKLTKFLITFILTFMAYPILFSIDRGSFEILLFVLLVFFVFFYMKGMNSLSVLCLSFAIACNIYCSGLAVLFLLNKKYIQFILTGLTSLVLTIGSAALLSGGVIATYKSWMINIIQFRITYLSGGSLKLGRSVSLYAPLRILSGDGVFTTKLYVIIAIILFAFIIYFIFRYKLSSWKVMTLLVFSYVFLPQISFDPSLIILFIPVILFINTNENSKFDLLYSFFFGALLIPKNYFIFSTETSISVVLNPLIILSLIFLLLFEAMTKINHKPVVINEQE